MFLLRAISSSSSSSSSFTRKRWKRARKRKERTRGLKRGFSLFLSSSSSSRRKERKESKERRETLTRFRDSFARAGLNFFFLSFTFRVYRVERKTPIVNNVGPPFVGSEKSKH